jgi:flagellar basal body-associated protein FliL
MSEIREASNTKDKKIRNIVIGIIIGIFICAAVAAIITAAGCGDNSEDVAKETVKQLNAETAAMNEQTCHDYLRIIDSNIMQYRVDHNDYPATVEDMVPEYMDNVYSCPDGGRYTIQRTADITYPHAVCPNGHSY